jgi:hypothetical protein
MVEIGTMTSPPTPGREGGREEMWGWLSIPGEGACQATQTEEGEEEGGEGVGEGGGEGGGWESLLVQLKEARASLQLLEVDKSVLEGDKARLRRHMEQVRCPTRPLALWFFLLLLFLH